MKKLFVAGTLGALLGCLTVAGGCSRTPSALAGPNGGDIVPIKDGAAYAELLANADTGEVMVHTWDWLTTIHFDIGRTEEAI